MVTGRTVAAAFGAVVLGLAMEAGSQATSVGRATLLSFNGPVALPGITLPAGSYMFERALPGDNAHIVRVSSANRKTVYLTTYTQLVPRPDGLPVDRLVMLGEASPGMAPPIKAWFPSGERQGHAFIYDQR